ncbi:hypothetical protein PF003_g5201 [Phytophthora fragariae]|nr:hypothetical protein PF003_g5201 [Phytophthora fragariae]
MEDIIRGVVGADAQKVCNCTSAKEMYDTLIAEKTQRDYSYAVHLKRELYTHSYTPGQKMADYIQEMNSLRQRLQHMGPSFVIDDTPMSQVLLMGVCAVHREIVTHFDFSYRQGNPPTLQQVRNALLARDELEKMVADSAVNSGVGASAMMHMGQAQGHNPGHGFGQLGGGPGPGAHRRVKCSQLKLVSDVQYAVSTAKRWIT